MPGAVSINGVWEFYGLANSSAPIGFLQYGHIMRTMEFQPFVPRPREVWCGICGRMNENLEPKPSDARIVCECGTIILGACGGTVESIPLLLRPNL